MQLPLRTLAAGLAGIAIAAAIAGWSSPGKAVPSDRPSLAALIPPEARVIPHIVSEGKREALRCLALNIYWEARSEPLDGQIAVAAVTLNRVRDARFPNEVCDVVYQGGETRRHRCQFSWWCDGKKDEPLEAAAWQRANVLARLAKADVLSDPTDGALWYHADYVDPFWAHSKEKLTKIGRHIFYRLPSDQEVSAQAVTGAPMIR